MIMSIVLIVAVPVSVFAADGIWVGPTALYNSNMTLGEMDFEDFDFEIENFSYGAEARFDISIFQVGINTIYYGDFDFLGKVVETNLNAGLYADFGIVGVGLTAGPKYLVFLDYDVDPMDWGYNIKVETDLILGSTILSVYFIGDVYDLDEWSEDPDFETLTGRVGASVLFQL